jgi:hypothetical protein
MCTHAVLHCCSCCITKVTLARLLVNQALHKVSTYTSNFIPISTRIAQPRCRLCSTDRCFDANRTAQTLVTMTLYAATEDLFSALLYCNCAVYCSLRLHIMVRVRD